MANDAQKIRFAPNGGVFVAPAPNGLPGGTQLPVDVGDGKAVPTGYKALGYVDEGGVTITPSIETDPVNAWQSATPVLYNVKSASMQIKATLLETNQLTSELFWGAPWIPVKDTQGQETGTYRLDLSSTPELQEITLVVDWSQKGVLYRCVIPRAMISDRGAITLQRTEAQKYELTISALDANGSLGYVLTNDSIKGTGGGVTPPAPFASTVTVPGFATNDGTNAAWSARVAATGITSPATIKLLNGAGTAFQLQTTLNSDGTYDVTIPKPQTTAEIKVTHAGVDYCYTVTDKTQTGSSKTCTVVSG
ncbi:hypothetical protein OG401_14300 [Kitasatospora purpeofusca]|uniref:phage tail tube protein n=1 Tax=Kitasatospora purpeofusca TaxID=67352 RepID=UPI00225AF8DD|nr:hypothetical protein [Kitasatospora purpeofusca]MCX4685470.1 hypothetical protein [Kitasatospora purpeofusca]